MTALEPLAALLHEVRTCRACAGSLPLGPRPIVQGESSARILLASQAPGARAHASGIPFDDASGERLRRWLGLDRERFYDASRIAILPMGFCFPGTARAGDLPPRPECAKLWRERLLAALPRIELTVVIGRYAQNYHLPAAGETLTEVVRNWRSFAPAIVPLPHPSPRNQAWFKRHPWFETEVVPALQQRVAAALREVPPP
ncbi:MAG: uracil-DNA glycosylase family protein [Thermoanaerobaculia bacterium]